MLVRSQLVQFLEDKWYVLIDGEAGDSLYTSKHTQI